MSGCCHRTGRGGGAGPMGGTGGGGHGGGRGGGCGEGGGWWGAGEWYTAGPRCRTQFPHRTHPALRSESYRSTNARRGGTSGHLPCATQFRPAQFGNSSDGAGAPGDTDRTRRIAHECPGGRGAACGGAGIAVGKRRSGLGRYWSGLGRYWSGLGRYRPDLAQRRARGELTWSRRAPPALFVLWAPVCSVRALPWVFVSEGSRLFLRMLRPPISRLPLIWARAGEQSALIALPSLLWRFHPM